MKPCFQAFIVSCVTLLLSFHVVWGANCTESTVTQTPAHFVLDFDQDTIDPPQSFSIVSWNIQHFGNTKDSLAISEIAHILVDFDLVILQEIVAGEGGPQAVVRLADQLDLAGTDWHYTISDPTENYDGCRSERYAFLWNSSTTECLSSGVLAVGYSELICREPFLSTFRINGIDVYVLNIHAIPWTADQHPSQELKYIKEIVSENENWLIAGDINCTSKETVFNPLRKMQFYFILENQKTTLKQSVVHGEYLANEKDNMLFNAQFMKLSDSGIIDTYQLTNSLEAARSLSDHVPIWALFTK